MSDQIKIDSHYLLDPPEHPLRKKLSKEDWKRIQIAMDAEDADSVTDEEVEAACDLLYDAIAAKSQTHEGVLILH